ncbi:MAG: HicB like antitoxin of bacterial toxin-antitoxin system [Candidatus Eremiobacteraeota bacterium]|jgi:predicted RNase H-like HicB family nuclease|nr:HicB like antitoxin of bacterial toxin-antitoxin system [Candidatus Eremiobacteraeota bacterium]
MVVSVIVESDEVTGTFAASSPDLPDVLAVGSSEEDAIARFINAARGHLEFLHELGREMPRSRTRVLAVAV